MSAPKTPAELMAEARTKVAAYRGYALAAAAARAAAERAADAADAVAKRDSTAWWAAYNVAW
ncbi:MAG: hypothetical protein ACRD2H_07340, partial [Terriglobales bacterium]